MSLPTVLGQKIWLFCDSVRAVKTSAKLCSRIEMAKANELKPSAYLRHLFTESPKAVTVEAIVALLTCNLTEDQLNIQPI